IKSFDLVSAYISRIKEVQPIINAVVEDRFQEALEDAKDVDKLVASGTMSPSQLSKEKPLLGLPFTAKNSIAIKGMRQDAGSVFWHGRRAVEDAPTVAFLRAAGAIPLALTNVPELCMWDDSQNLVDGCTRNPHDTRRSPGGSSGGEGSLLASAGSLIGLGTDIGGSVRIPSAYCGIFGHKPTAGVVPNTGLLPDVGENLEQYNCVGPMTRFAEDLPLLLKVLSGKSTDVFRLNEKVNLKTVKLHYMDNEGSLYISRVVPDARRAVRRVVQYLKGGARTRRASAAAARGEIRQLSLVQVSGRQGCHAPGRDVQARRIQHSSRTAPLPCGSRPDLALMESSSMTALFNLFKVPVTVCPVMRSADNLPLCVQVVAKRGNDRLCLAVAKEIENRFGGWIDPTVKLQGRV
ncbi:hypothetical protein MTO96_026771, partial [Rhipicephalus appendiculatus]